MAGDVDNPRIWLNADVYVADLGTTAPVDVVAAWAAGWEFIGLLGEDGMTEAREQDSTDHYAWGSILVRNVRSRHKRTFVVNALEDTHLVFGLLNPGSTALTSAGPTPPTGTTTRTVKVPTSDPRAFGFELVDGDLTKRIVIPRGEVTEVGDRTFSDSEMDMRELTITVYPTSDGTLYTEITDDPQADTA
jgi:hypothetical protein